VAALEKLLKEAGSFTPETSRSFSVPQGRVAALEKQLKGAILGPL